MGFWVISFWNGLLGRIWMFAWRELWELGFKVGWIFWLPLPVFPSDRIKFSPIKILIITYFFAVIIYEINRQYNIFSAFC